MKRSPRLICLLGASLTAIFQVASVFAQTTTATSPEETIQLSPFVVSADSEKGYLATETLAGTRIKTDLRDVAASIDVLTKTFLDDVGAIDVNDALKYVANVNLFVGDSGDSSNNTQWFDYKYVSRGIGGTTVLTDFFPTGSVPIDRYNVDNITVARGPNAILYGIGSPSGVIGASTKRALLNKNLHTVRFVIDSNESARTELDISRVLVPDKLAVRVAAVASDKKSFNQPSLNRRNAVFGTVSYQPFSRTKITANLENGIYDRIHVPSTSIRDAYTPWVLAGRPTVNWKTGAGQTAAGKGNYTTSDGSGLSKDASGTKLIYIDGSNQPIQDWQNMATGQNFNAASPVFSGYGITGPDVNNLGSRGFNESTNTLTLPDGTSWKLDLDANVFGGLRRNDLDYNSQSVFVEQNILRDLDVELALNRFDMRFIFDNFGTDTAIKVDPNELLPNGNPNPNVGRPYIESGINTITREKRVWETARATVSYKLDLDDHKIFRKIGLGNYRFSGLYERQDKDNWLVDSRLVNTIGTNLNQNADANIIRRRYYLQPGESTYQFTGPSSFSEAGIEAKQANAGAPPRRAYQGTRSFVGAIQGQWWQSSEGYFRLIGLYGVRRDTQLNRTMAGSFKRNPVTGLLQSDFNDFDSIDPTGIWSTSPDTKADTKTYSLIARPLSFLSVFFNYSDVFRVGDPAFDDVNGVHLRPSFGDTHDYGIKLNLWQDRIYATVTKYETKVFDQTSDQFATMMNRMNDIYTAIGKPELKFQRKFFGYRDDLSEGSEVAIVANITSNWRSRVSVGVQHTKIEKLYDEVQAYVDANLALWKGAGDANLALPLPNPTSAGNAPSTGYMTVDDAIRNVVTEIADKRAVLGTKPNNLREYNATFTTNYSFTTGMLKGFRAGGGVRWASSNILGYGRDSARRLTQSIPFEGPEQFDTDLSLGYSRKFGRDGRFVWDVQLNVYNVLDDHDPKPMTAVASATNTPVVDRTYRVAPRSFQLTNSFRF